MFQKCIQITVLVIFLYMHNACCMQDSKPQTLGQKLTAITLAARGRAGQPKTLHEYAEMPGSNYKQDLKAALTKLFVGEAGWWYKTTTLEHTQSVEKLLFSSSGKLIGTVIDNSGDNSDDQTEDETPPSPCGYLACIWNSETAQLDRTIPIQAMDFNSQDSQQTSAHMAIVDNANISILDTKGNVSYSIPLDEHEREVQDVTLYPNQHIVSAKLRDDVSDNVSFVGGYRSTNTKGVSLYDYTTGKMILHLNAHKIVCDPKGTLIGVIKGDNSAYLGDYDGRQLHALEQLPCQCPGSCIHSKYVWDIAFNPAQNIVATVVSKGACLWDYKGTLLHTLLHPEVHDLHVMHATFNPQGTLLATAAWDGTVCLWDCNTGELLRAFSNHGSMAAPAFSPQGTKLAMASNAKVHVWQQHQRPTLEQVLLWHIIQKWLLTVTAEKKNSECTPTSEKDVPLWMATRFNVQKDELHKVWQTMPETLRVSILNTITESMVPAQKVDEIPAEEDFEYMPDTDVADDADDEKVDLFL